LSEDDIKCLKLGPRFHVGFTLLLTFTLPVSNIECIANSTDR